MKVRRKKLLTVLICVALSVTDILPVGFSVSASERSTGEVDSSEECVATEDEEIKEIGMGKEDISAESTEVQVEEIGKNTIEIETQEESSVIEETESDNTGSDTLGLETEQEYTEADTASGDNIASGHNGDITWVIDADGKLTVTGTGDFMEPKTGESLWYNYKDFVTSAEINVTGANYASWMFSGHKNLIHVDISNFDIGNIVDMSGMFFGCNSLVDLNLDYFNTTSVEYMGEMFSGCSNLTNLNICNFDTRNVKSMFDMFKGCSSLASVDVSGFDTRNVISMFSMFSGCSSLTNIDVSGFDMSNVDNMSCMFEGCSSLMSVDVSGFDTSNVTDMSDMFLGCCKLTKIDVSGFKTSNVTDIRNMFSGCSSLTSIDVSGFDMSNVTDMYAMFRDCSSLTSVDVSGFDTGKVTCLNGMFDGCSSLTSVNVSSFDTSNATDMYAMFRNCNSLTSLDVSGFDMSNVEDVSYMFEGCRNLTTIYTPCNLTKSVSLPKEKNEDVWYQTDGTVLIELPKDLNYSIMIRKNSVPTAATPHIIAEKVKTVYKCGDSLTIDDLTVRLYNTDGTVKKITDYSTNKDEIDMSTIGKKELKVTYGDMETIVELTVVSSSNIASGSYENITWVIDTDGKLTVTGTGDFAKPTAADENEEDYYNRAPWYDYRTSIISAEINVTDMTDAACMFYDCNNLVDIDLSGFDTKDVTNMTGMFLYCGSLMNIDLSGINTANVTTMRMMFYGCENLLSLDLRAFNTIHVKDMTAMFTYCYNLTGLDLSGFNTTNVTTMRMMFEDCNSLINLDVSNFNTANVTDMSGMFEGCFELTNLDLSNFDTRNVTDMSWIFYNSFGLTNINLNNFDTRNVVNMFHMFDDCIGLTSLNLSNFDTRNVTDIDRMFRNCSRLTNLDLSNFDVSNVTKKIGIVDMFDGCNGLNTVYTPYNLILSVPLPKESTNDNWYQSDGTVITELPQDLPYSTIIAKNTIPTIENPYIMVQKNRATYVCGETLNIDDLTVKICDIDGTVKTITDYTTNADTIDMSTVGTKILVITYNNLTAEIELTVTDIHQDTTYTVTFDMCGHGAGIAPITDITAGSPIAEPQPPVAEGYRFIGWYKDSSCIYVWDFDKDTVQENITLYAYWIVVEDYTEIGNLFIQGIPAQTYSGSALKPAVTVYYQSANGRKLLKAGTDYTIKYYNNIQADTEAEKNLGGTGQTETDSSNGFTKDLAYVVITCKGNYTGNVYRNFHINPASIAGDGQDVAKGFTLKCTEQFASSTKSLKPFSSLKYKKGMKAGTDYNVKLTVQKAYDINGNALTEGSAIDENSVIPAIPAGYQGTFLMTITGINNFEGTITRTIYVADKKHLIKNASVSLGKNQKSMKYTGEAVTLSPAWYDVSAKKYYAINEDGGCTETDKNNIFTIKLGTEYLLYGRDFTISYLSNRAVGNATMTVTGIGGYVGTQNVTFRIIGTAFNARNIRVSNLSASLIYIGEALTQNGVVLTDISGAKPYELVCGTDYTVAYKNNLKKGTATMTFTAKPISGYSGSFKKTFKITVAGLGEITDIAAKDPYNDSIKTANGNLWLDGEIIYTKEGARPSDRIVLTNRNTNNVLKEGIDYTVSYANNKAVTMGASFATMTIKGKGNYVGIIPVNFSIIKASLSGNENLKVTSTSIAYNAKKADDYRYRPQIKLMDQKKALNASKDYEIVEYKNCFQSEVKAYLDAMKSGTATADARPYAVIKAKEESGYGGSLEVDLNIYQTKLTAKNLYIIVSTETEQVTYTEKQVRPEVAVYYGESEAVKQAKNAGEIRESTLTDKSGSYKLTKLNPKENGLGDYILTYGVNITAGKNKGSVTVGGVGLYGGKVTVKFTILGKDVHNKGK